MKTTLIIGSLVFIGSAAALVCGFFLLAVEPVLVIGGSLGCLVALIGTPIALALVKEVGEEQELKKQGLLK